MNETELIDKLEDYYKEDIKEKLSHVNQIDILENIFVDMKKSFLKLNIKKTDKFTNPMKKIQIIVLTEALMEIVESVLSLLKSKLYNGSDPLTRIALEHSINLLYLLEDDTNRRSKEFIKNFIDETIKKTKQWHDYSLKSNHTNAINISKQKLELFKEMKEQNFKLYKDSSEEWPKPYKRFQLCGHEGAYRTLYAMNSDSVHNLAEDAYNFSTILNYPEELQPLVQQHFKATNISLAIYHGIKTLYYFGLVLVELASKLNDDTEKCKIINLINSLAPLQEIHGDEVTTHN